MKQIILAAGYATRLYPLTLDCPKPLLTVGGKTIVDHLLDRLAPVHDVRQVYVVTNSKYAGRFQSWADSYRRASARFELTVIDDGTDDEAKRLGAIGDLRLVLDSQAIDDDIIVVAGDNLFSYDLKSFGDYCREIAAPVVGIYDVGSLEEIKRLSSVIHDTEGRITFFEEKPENPRSTVTGTTIYYYPRRTLPLVRQYLSEGNNADQPGRLVQWMFSRTAFYTWRVPGHWYDIGSREALEAANRIFATATEPPGRSSDLLRAART